MYDASAAVSIALTSTTPIPTPSMTVDPELVSPGPLGFVVIAIIVLAVVLLIWDMMRRIRRGRVRADINEQLDAEAQAAEAVEATETDDDDVDPDSPWSKTSR